MTAHAKRDAYELSSDQHRIDVAVVHAFLAQSYWSPGIPHAIVARAIANSLCFGVYCDGQQVGFARVITDKATFAYLSDVFILEPHRGKGLSKWLVEFILQHEALQGLRRFMLVTKDAHSLYEGFGFAAPANPPRVMEILKPDAYRLAS
ncbi:GNAT superfamily N-acetyltransferase [Actimicrobium sp. GrIS 1.19]|uniref:GNAT family N-acetyltransferase n=1 Tax=Actimicrobium sp. GrIS 1.19 TaxID=3071708 RepID=UPI002E09B52B|nr:GNAT superfamily N-acetyltransferase [Actimicrobium sp. GrIS 1.19]